MVRKNPIGPVSVRSKTRAPEKIYKDFHGRAPNGLTKVPFRIPRGLIYLGEAVAVEYLSNKLNGGGDGKKAVYRHDCPKGQNIVCTDEGRKQLYVLGPKQIVTSRGIVN
ncbi:MAG: hypothetical protein WC906_04120 [Parcubacteria group bacterium]|jgi:hypothetical protein